jgi:hypothetical protein
MARKSIMNMHGRQLFRLALLTLPVVLILSWTPPGQATPSSPQQATGNPTLLAEALAENGRAAAGVPGPVTAIPGAQPAGTGTDGVAHSTGRKDLTVFFSIGVIVDILLVTAFLVWAVGQWSKSKNRS